MKPKTSGEALRILSDMYRDMYTLTLPDYLKIGNLPILSMRDFSAPLRFEVGDKVRITEQLDPNYGTTGTITKYDNMDNSYLIEFEFDTPFGPTKHTDWFYGTSDFVSASSIGPARSSNNLFYCNHEWREDTFFTKQVYKTCKLCGAKHEELDDGVPF